MNRLPLPRPLGPILSLTLPCHRESILHKVSTDVDRNNAAKFTESELFKPQFLLSSWSDLSARCGLPNKRTEDFNVYFLVIGQTRGNITKARSEALKLENVQ